MASSTSSSVAPGLAMRTFSRMVVLNRYTSWKTIEIIDINCSVAMSLTSTPPMVTRPADTSQNLAASFVSVDLPQPEGPTIAVIWPCGASREKSWNSGASGS